MKATYVSVWDGEELRSSCDYDPQTNDVTDIEQLDVDDMDLCTCEDEFIELPTGDVINEFTIDGEEV